MNPDSSFCFGAAILAAGRSLRMGRPKPLLPWGDSTIIAHLVRSWRVLGAAQVAVVCAPGDKALEAELERIGLGVASRITNPNPDRGMFSSIQSAACWERWEPSLTHFAIVLADQPQTRLSTLHALLRFSAAHPGSVCQPACNGHPAHPVLLPRRDFNRLCDTGEATLKDFLASREIQLCELEDPGLHLDLDTPEDYAKAQRL